MTRPTRHDRTVLPLDVLDQIDQICDRFEGAWKSGERPRVEDYLGDVATNYRPALFCDLLAAEWDARRRRGEWPCIDEYVANYPELHHQIRALFPAMVTPDQAESFVDSATETDGAPVTRHLGDFLILREIGRGGMGVVYKSVQQSLGRHVALKVLPRQALAGASQLERFRLEARAAGRLHHTNIVPVYGVGECDDVHYYAMQFIAGRGLDVVIDAVRGLHDATGPIDVAGVGLIPKTISTDDQPRTAVLAVTLLYGPFGVHPPQSEPRMQPGNETGVVVAGGQPHNRGPSRVSSSFTPEIAVDPAMSGGRLDLQYFRNIARIGVQVAEALAYAHGQGVLHRDIKPSNLLLDANGTVWVTDFGLAKAEGSDGPTQTGEVVGTLRYMAPERFEGRSDPRSDVYGLGATLYELLTLHPPFQESNKVRLIDQVLHECPPPLRRLERRIPHDLETIVHTAMAQDPSRRYATAGALAEDLSRFIEDRPIRARRVSTSERAWRWSKRNPWLAGLSAALLLSLVGGTIVASFLAARAADHAEKADLEARRATDQAGRANRLADNLKTSLDRSNQLTDKHERLLNESNRTLAVLYFERGLAECERGTIGPGLLWMVKSWRSAVAAGDEAWQHTTAASLTAWQVCHVEVKDIFSHSRPVDDVAFSPDGKTILTGCSDNSARLWDMATGRHLGQPLTHQGRVLAVAFSPDGRTVLTGSYDMTAQLWDAATGRPVGQPLTHQYIVNAAVFSPDGKTILTGSNGAMAWLWDAATGRLLGPPLLHQDIVNAAVFSPDGKTAVTASWDRTARLWDAATGRPLGRPLTHQQFVNAVAFSPDGKTILTGCSDNSARLWDAATGRPLGPPLTHQDAVNAVAFSPDGKSILTGSDDTSVRLWDAATGRPLGPPLTHQDAVNAVAFSPDGKTILTGSDDTTARLWGTTTSLVGLPLDHQDQVRAVAFSPDGKTVLTGSCDRTARLWDAATGRPLGQPLTHQDYVIAVAFSPDGKTVLTGSKDRTARLWDAATGKPFGRTLMHYDDVNALAFSPDGKTVLTGSKDRTARLWDAATGRPLGRTLTHIESILAVSFSPDGKTALTGSYDQSARLWDLATGRSIGQPPTHPSNVVREAFSPDGKTILTGSDRSAEQPRFAVADRPTGQPFIGQQDIGAVAFSPDGKSFVTGSDRNGGWLWDSATGLVRIYLYHQDQVRAVAFSPDGKTVLTGSCDRTARLWDAATGKPLGRILTHKDNVNRVAFSPDGKTVLTGSRDRTARFWDAATGQPLGQPLTHQGSVVAIAFSPDGKTALTGSEDKTARLWDAPIPPGDIPYLVTRVEVATGLELDSQGQVQALTTLTLRERREQLARQGGSTPNPMPRRDPILFGTEPAARADALAANNRTAQAEASYADALRARPLNSSAWIGRARFYAAQSRPEEAAADFAKAFALGDRRPELLSDIMTDDAMFARVIAHSSADDLPALGLERGRYFVARQDWNRAEAVFTQALALSPDEVRLRMARADARAGRAAWREAAADYSRALELDPSIHHSWYKLAALWPYLGDMEACRQHRRRMLERFATTDDASIAERTSKACLLLPPEPAELDQARQLSEYAVAMASPLLFPYAKLVQGLAEYRRGHLREAIRCLHQSLARDIAHWGIRIPAHWLLAMAHLRLGEVEAARTAWAKAVALEEDEMPRLVRDDLGVDWHDWVICAILRREANALFLNRWGQIR